MTVAAVRRKARGTFVQDKELPLAYMAVFLQEMIEVNRLWILGRNLKSRMLKCFVQDGYCYLNKRWNDGSGEKDAMHYPFALHD